LVVSREPSVVGQITRAKQDFTRMKFEVAAFLTAMTCWIQLCAVGERRTTNGQRLLFWHPVPRALHL